MAAWSLFPYSNSGYADLKGIYVIKTTSFKSTSSFFNERLIDSKILPDSLCFLVLLKLHRSCSLAYCRAIDPELTLDSKRKETLNEFLEVLRELVARDSATVEGKPQQSTENEKQCENIYFEGSSR